MNSLTRIYRRLFWAGIILLGIVVVGTTGYWFISDGKHSLIDTFYMTIITITTIGFGEIIDLSTHPLGRLFTVGIAISGIGVLAYVVTNLTALVIEGEFSELFRRKKMERLAGNAKDHYIICGLGFLGWQVAKELSTTQRPYLIIDPEEENVKKNLETLPDPIFLEGDATDNSVLVKAGINRAKGLFATTDDDNLNLVICLTANQLNPNIRVVTRCKDIQNSEKMKKAGAYAVVSPSSIGGLRMASEMIRPTVVSFLDIMLRDTAKNLRVEEITIPSQYFGKPISSLNLKKYIHTVLLAVKLKEDWVYAPGEHFEIQPNSILIVMTNLEDRQQMEKLLHQPI